MKQKKRKTVRSPTPKNQLFRISAGIIVMVLLWLVFAPGRGIFFLNRQTKHLAALKIEQQKLIYENKEIQNDIARLLNDERYLEDVARIRHGMMKDNEMVFDFSKEKKKDND